MYEKLSDESEVLLGSLGESSLPSNDSMGIFAQSPSQFGVNVSLGSLESTTHEQESSIQTHDGPSSSQLDKVVNSSLDNKAKNSNLMVTKPEDSSEKDRACTTSIQVLESPRGSVRRLVEVVQQKTVPSIWDGGQSRQLIDLDFSWNSLDKSVVENAERVEVASPSLEGGPHTQSPSGAAEEEFSSLNTVVDALDYTMSSYMCEDKPQLVQTTAHEQPHEHEETTLKCWANTIEHSPHRSSICNIEEGDMEKGPCDLDIKQSESHQLDFERSTKFKDNQTTERAVSTSNYTGLKSKGKCTTLHIVHNINVSTM